MIKITLLLCNCTSGTALININYNTLYLKNAKNICNDSFFYSFIYKYYSREGNRQFFH